MKICLFLKYDSTISTDCRIPSLYLGKSIGRYLRQDLTDSIVLWKDLLVQLGIY